MSGVVGWILGLPIIAVIVWLTYYFWNNDRILDTRIENGDMSLLSSSNYKINEIVKAPAGSRVENMNHFAIANIEGGYIRKHLPDGSIALIPAINATSDVKSPVIETHIDKPPLL